MAYSSTIQQNVTSGGVTITAVKSFTGGGHQGIDESVANSETDMLVVMTLDVSQIKSLYILSDQDITLETNDGGSPANTIALLAGVPYVWHEKSYHTNLLTVDITALYLTNASGSTAKFKLEAVYDPTP